MYKQKSNPFNAPILKVDMEEGVVGTANKDGTIHVNKDVTDPDKIKDIVLGKSEKLVIEKNNKNNTIKKPTVDIGL